MENITPVLQTSAQKNTETELIRLLQQRLEHPEQIDAIDAHIQQTFVETHAILILDMSGFSRLGEEYSIIHTLAHIQHMRTVVTPIIQSHQGTLLKFEADNVYAIFPLVDVALTAAQMMMQQLAEVSIHASIGIGYGELIMIADEVSYKDAFGNQMNLASKLGEDLAEAGEILLTEAAFQQLSHRSGWHSQEMKISGLSLQVFSQ